MSRVPSSCCPFCSDSISRAPSCLVFPHASPCSPFCSDNICQSRSFSSVHSDVLTAFRAPSSVRCTKVHLKHWTKARNQGQAVNLRSLLLRKLLFFQPTRNLLLRCNKASSNARIRMITYARQRSCSPCQCSVDYGNTKRPRMQFTGIWINVLLQVNLIVR